MVYVLYTVIQTILYVRSSEVRNLYHARRGMYHHRVASKVIVMGKELAGEDDGLGKAIHAFLNLNIHMNILNQRK
jgi:hypothetical protein